MRPRPSSLTYDVAALVRCRQGNRAGFVLAGGAARIGHFQAVVDRVAHQVHQRIGDLFDQALVQLGAFANGAQAHLLAEAAGEVAYQAREAAEHRIHRQHAHADDRFLQIAGIALEQIQAGEQLFGMRRVQAGGDLLEHGLGDHQFADQIDQCIDLVDADADRAFGFGSGGLGRCRRGGSRFGSGARCSGNGCNRCGRRSVHGQARRRAGHGHRADVQFAVVHHPGKGVFDLAARNLADQAQVPRQIRFQRIDVFKTRHALQTRGDLQRAQVFELADDAQRVVAAHEQRRRRRETDVPGFGFFFLGLGDRRGGRRFASEHGIQPGVHGLDRSRIGRGAVFGFAQQGAQHIDRAKHGIDRIGFELALVGAQLVQQRLQHVGQPCDGVETEGGSAALDRVRGAEHRVDDFRVAVAFFKRQQPGLHRVEPFTAFLEKGGVETLQVHAHGREIRS